VEGKKFCILGGDLRSIKLADLIAADGNCVHIFGYDAANFDIAIKQSNTIAQAINDAEIIIGPIPCSNDNENINAPFHNEKISINETFKFINKNQLFLAGRISDKISHLAQVYNIFTIDLLQREEMAILNAIPTAEGAIQIAMEELPITLHNSNVLLLGYGRLGKILVISISLSKSLA
jgi:dipicolinate synthase subunit A